jgi:hypothetical protein
MTCHNSEPGRTLRDESEGSRFHAATIGSGKGFAVTRDLPQTPAWVLLLRRVPGGGAVCNASAHSLRSVWIAFHPHKRRSELQL